MLKKLALCFLLALTLTGCGSEDTGDQPGIALVVIAGNHANANTPSPTALASTGELVAQSYSRWYDQEKGKSCAQANLAVIALDGMPRKVTLNTQGLIVKNSAAGRDAQVEQDATALTAQLSSVQADDPEVDILAALSEADKLLAQMEGEEKHIVLLDGGFPTAGKGSLVRPDPINPYETTAQAYLDTIPEDAFPDLSDVQISVFGLGNVAAPQPDYRGNGLVEQWLVSFWQTTLEERCHATVTTPLQIAPSEGTPMVWTEEGDGFPSVKPVFFLDKDPSALATPAVFSASAVQFLPDSARFLDEAEALRVISANMANMVTSLTDSPDSVLYVVGSIAQVDGAVSSHPLSADRATAVATVLGEKLGIDSQRIVTIDAGTTPFTWRPSDPNNLQASRVVAVISSDDANSVAELQSAGYLS